jgi:hypothetical protein
MGPRAAGSIALAAGLALGLLAVPRLIAGIELVPAGPVLEALRAGETVAEPHAIGTAAAIERSLDWVRDAQGYADLSLIYWEEARRAGLSTPAGVGLVRASEAAVLRTIALNPSNPIAWTRRAQISLLTTGIDDTLARELRMALRTAPYDRIVLAPRVGLALYAWPRLDEPTRALVRDQIRVAAMLDARTLAAAARRTFAVAVVREALASEPDRLRNFERFYARLN